MGKNANWNDDIVNEYMNSGDDFGFTTVDPDELNKLMAGPSAKSEEIEAIKTKLDQILELNSTCEGAMQVKEQYEQLLKARMQEIEKNIVPLLLNLKKNEEKDYIYWPGKQRQAQCDLQIQKLLNLTRNNL
jgi:hypothetical protein